MLDFQWDSFTTFPHPQTGEPLVEWAVSTVGTTKVEMSMSDAKIWEAIPRKQWLGVMLAANSNAKMDRSGGVWTVLFGFGCPNDPAGNLMLVRVHSDFDTLKTKPESPDAQQFARATRAIILMFQKLGIALGSNFDDKTRSN